MTGANVYSAYAEGSQSYDAARKRRAAFEANVVSNLEKDRASLGVNSIALTRAIGAAHVRVRHALDARTSFPFFGKRYYVVLQSGLARRQRTLRATEAGPLAERVLSRIDPYLLQDMSDAECNSIAAAIDQAEITRPHPVDMRVKLPLPGLRFYLNFIGGEDKRTDTASAAGNRRAPVNETLGFMVFALLITLVAALGVTLVASTFADAVQLASDPAGREALWQMTTTLFGNALSGGTG